MVSTFLVHHLFTLNAATTSFDVIVPAIAAAGAGACLLLGFWTPVAGSVAAGLELWLAFSGQEELWPAFLASGIAVGLTLLGPGAWSLDSLAYGRKRISFGDR